MTTPGLDTFDALKAAVLSRGGEATDGSSDWDTDVTVAIDERWRELWMLHPWLGLMAYPPQAFMTAAGITTLTLTVAVESQTITLSAIPTDPAGANVSLLNWWVMPTGKTYFFRVTAHTAGQLTATIDVAAPETLTAVGCNLAKLEYDLASGTGILADGCWTDGGGYDGAFIPVQPEETLKLDFPGLPQQSWPPQAAARIGSTKLRLFGWDTTAHRVEVPYLQEQADPSGAATLAIPTYLRGALLQAALSILYELKGDARRPIAEARYEAYLKRAKDYETRLRTGLGSASAAVRREPYGESSYRGVPYS